MWFGLEIWTKLLLVYVVFERLLTYHSDIAIDLIVKSKFLSSKRFVPTRAEKITLR